VADGAGIAETRRVTFPAMDLGRGDLYIGRDSDNEQPVIYEADNLTTHGVIVGMTGSGKTGLGIDLIEEALLSQIPCLIIDPKGDMGNLALNFPDLKPADFEPWMDPATAKKEGRTPAELAEDTAERWKTGLESNEIGPDRMRHLAEGSQVTVYTPGSGAGVSLNVLGSMAVPALDWDTQAETIRDEIEAIVSSLLVLADIESDPVSGPEHIFLSNLIEAFWTQGKDLDLETLIGQIPKPPFRKLGVFDVDTFFPAKERMDLALKLNGLLASPSFATWMEGEPLDIESMLAGGEATKAAVVYMSHLSDSERQFLVTLLLSKMVTWIRTQPGTSELRALIYMDEVFGFVPPTAEPPSKKPILTILKQARAHGVGMVLSTQNPVDLDYKAMSNAGTWMIGRLQTENDKRRILEGLESASGTVDVDRFDKLISDLDKRQFVLHSTKLADPVVFASRWAMSYLAGPLTRDQVASLMADRQTRESPSPIADPIAAPETRLVDDETTSVAPEVAEGISVKYLDPGAPWAAKVGADPTGFRYEAGVAATVQLLYDETKAGLSHAETYEAVIFPVDEIIDFGEVTQVDHEDRDFLDRAREGMTFGMPSEKLHTKTFWSDLERSLETYLVANRPVEILANESLGIYSRVDESETEFHRRCQEVSEEAADEEIRKLHDRFQTRIERVKDEISKAEVRVRELEGEAAAKQQNELISGAGDLLGALLGGRKRSNPLGRAADRRAATTRARTRVDTAWDRLTDKQQALVELEDELADEISSIAERYAGMADEIEALEVGLEKADIQVADLKLIWIPT
jgi:hypothetical protein